MKLSNFLASLSLVDGSQRPDELAIALASYFEKHEDRPENDPDTEHGWGEWSTARTEETLEQIAEKFEAHVSAEKDATIARLQERLRLAEATNENSTELVKAVGAFLQYGKSGGDTTWYADAPQSLFYSLMVAHGKCTGEIVNIQP